MVQLEKISAFLILRRLYTTGYYFWTFLFYLLYLKINEIGNEDKFEINFKCPKDFKYLG